jgi:hypothetical protein
MDVQGRDGRPLSPTLGDEPWKAGADDERGTQAIDQSEGVPVFELTDCMDGNSSVSSTLEGIAPRSHQVRLRVEASRDTVAGQRVVDEQRDRRDT